MTHTHHFGVTQGIDIPKFRITLSGTCNSFIKWQENRLRANCTKVWWQTNRLGESFLFGKFCHDGEWTPVTLSYYVPNVGWVTLNRDVIEFRLAHNPVLS